MSWTKRQLILTAFEEIGLAAYAFDLQAEQLQSALYRLDAMVAGWASNGINIAYPMAQNPMASNIDDDTVVPDYAAEALYTNLAIRIAPGYGKTISVDLKTNAKSTYDDLLRRFSLPPQMQLPGTMPRGAGQKQVNIQQPFLTPPNLDPIKVGHNEQLEFAPK